MTEGVLKPNVGLEEVLLTVAIDDGKDKVDESRATVAAREFEIA